MVGGIIDTIQSKRVFDVESQYHLNCGESNRITEYDLFDIFQCKLLLLNGLPAKLDEALIEFNVQNPHKLPYKTYGGILSLTLTSMLRDLLLHQRGTLFTHLSNSAMRKPQIIVDMAVKSCF